MPSIFVKVTQESTRQKLQFQHDPSLVITSSTVLRLGLLCQKVVKGQLILAADVVSFELVFRCEGVCYQNKECRSK